MQSVIHKNVFQALSSISRLKGAIVIITKKGPLEEM